MRMKNDYLKYDERYLRQVSIGLDLPQIEKCKL